MTQPDHDPIRLPPQPKPLSEVDLSVVTNLVSEYNDQFGLGNKLASLIFGAIGDEEGIDQVRPRISLVQAEERAEPVLKATGIGFETVRGSATVFVQGGEFSTSELRINLVDGQKFAGYLDAIDPQTMTDTQAQGLISVADSLTTQLVSQYRLNDANDDRFFELFGNADRIITNYRRLGAKNEAISTSVERLEKYIQTARKGYLREQLAAESGQLLNRPGSHTFGPSEWQCDITVGGYIDRWNRVLATLEAIGSNPRASELYQQALQNLKACTAYARSDMDILEKDKGYSKEMLDSFRTTLIEVERRLGEMGRPSESQVLSEL